MITPRYRQCIVAGAQTSVDAVRIGRIDTIRQQSKLIATQLNARVVAVGVHAQQRVLCQRERHTLIAADGERVDQMQFAFSLQLLLLVERRFGGCKRCIYLC
jgi:hypothetical protein